MGSLKRNLVYSTLATIINVAVGLAAIPFITRHMLPSDFGHLSLLLLFFYLFVFLDGMQPVVIRFTNMPVYARADVVKNSRVLSWGVGGAVSVVTFSVLVLLYEGTFSLIEEGLMGICALMYFPMSIEGALLESKERVGFTSMARSGVWTMVYLSFVIYVILKLPFEWYALSLAGMNSFLWGSFKIANTGEPRTGKLEKVLIREMIIETKKVIVYNLCVAVMTFSDRLFISRFLALSKLGYYSVQYELGTKGYMLPYTVSRVLYPNFSRRLASEKLSDVYADWKVATKLIFFIMFSISLTAFIFSEEIVRLYAGDAYASHDYVFKFVMIGITINSLGFMGALFQRAKGDFVSPERAYLIGAGLGIVLVYPLVKGFGLAGAALFYLCVRSADIILVWKLQRDMSVERNITKHLVWTLLFIFSYVFTYVEYYAVALILYVILGVTLFDYNDVLSVKRIWKEYVGRRSESDET